MTIAQRDRRAAGTAPNLAALMLVASVAEGERKFGTCAACHAIRRGAPDRNRPNLFGVMGGGIAKTSPRFGYTAALRRVGGRWTRERMDAWLAYPHRFTTGTAMTYPGMPDPLDRADVIAFLETQR